MQEPQNLVCIYCLAENPKFNREHVIPEAFGGFDTNNFVLHDTVCWDCNHYFSKHHDLILARSSSMGVARYMLGYKSATDLNKRDHRRVTATVRYHDIDVPVMFGESADGKPYAEKKPGLFYRSSETGELKFVVIEDIETGRATLDDLVRGEDVEIYEGSFSTERIVATLRRAGLEMELRRREPGSDEITPVTITFGTVEDDMVLRAVAKIAFNYLAAVRGAAFVLMERFNPIRKYIRYGDSGGLRFAGQIDPPETISGEYLPAKRRGHLLQFGTDGNPPVFSGVVTLYGERHYMVHYAPNSGPLSLPIDSIHYFDVQERRITKGNVIHRSL